jgi:fluoroquinolone resistance protein
MINLIENTPFMTIAGSSLSRGEIVQLASSKQPVFLRDCDLTEIDLSNLDMTGWRFEECILKRTNFTSVALEYAAFVRCRGPFVNFAAAKLGEARMENCDFNNGTYHGATVTEAQFIGCKLTGADFTRARTNAIIFKETILSAAYLSGISFRKTAVDQVDFCMADLSKCDFRDAIFYDSSLREANLVDARFEGADLRGADLGGIRLNDARRFRGATISRAQAGALLAEMGLKVL